MSRPLSRGEKECSKLEQTILLASTARRVDLKQSGAYKFQAYGPMNARRCHSAVPDRAACWWPQEAEAEADAALAAARASELEPEIGAANIGFKDDDLAFCCWPLFA